VANGQLTHVEFPADDLERVKRFYSGLLGWEISDLPEFADYPLFTFGEIKSAGGAFGLRGKNVGQRLRVYIDVDSLDATLPKVEPLGGKVIEPKTEIPGQGWYAVINDTEGTELGLYESLPRSQM
jgi:predicted enzyme related to lactoylglutathione lyase